jgi:hypothetical protein
MKKLLQQPKQEPLRPATPQDFGGPNWIASYGWDWWKAVVRDAEENTRTTTREEQ